MNEENSVLTFPKTLKKRRRKKKKSDEKVYYRKIEIVPF